MKFDIKRYFGADNFYLTLEFCALFVLIPLSLKICKNTALLPIALWTASVFCAMALLADPSFDRHMLWNSADIRIHIRGILARFILLGAVLAAITAFTVPDSAFALIKHRPVLWLAIVVLYPLLSVYPQAVIWRAFLFHRYRDLVKTKGAMIATSAAAFAFSHIVFSNWQAVTLSAIGGIIFARTYSKTRSLLLSSIEHALFGCLIFTIGLGKYFYHGAF